MDIVITAVVAAVALGLGLLIGSLQGRQKGKRAAEELAQEQAAAAAHLEAAVEERTAAEEALRAEQETLAGQLAEEQTRAAGLESELVEARSRIATIETERLRLRRFADGQFKVRFEQLVAAWEKARLPLRVEELLAAKAPDPKTLEDLRELVAPLRDSMEQLGVGTAEVYFHLGLFQTLEGHLREALDAFHGATEKGMGFEAWLAQGDLQWQLERRDRALHAYRRCLRAENMPHRLYFRIGDAAIGKGRYKDALAALENLLSNRRKQPEEVFHLASFAAGKLERYEKAVEICRAGLKVHRGSVELLSDLVIPLARLGRDEEAEEAYLQAAEKNPESARPAFTMGVARMHQERHAAAADFLLEAIRLDPAMAEAHFCLGVLANREQRWKAAIERFEAALEIKPDYAEAYYNMKDAYEGLRDFDKAVAALDQATRLNPNYR